MISEIISDRTTYVNIQMKTYRYSREKYQIIVLEKGRMANVANMSSPLINEKIVSVVEWKV